MSVERSIPLVSVALALAFSCGAVAPVADVVGVAASGAPGAYRFQVTISSPDTGCDRYADWWEVLSEEGDLIYRRVLTHSHVDEQPFERSGGPVKVQPDQLIFVRAHLHPTGYGGKAAQGTVTSGFEPTRLASDFASAAAQLQPLPEGCRF